MESMPTLEAVLYAVNALYRNPDVVGKEKASIWLGELQRSVFAWQISDQLLRLHRDTESCYFAAQTMRTKIQYAFHELPQTAHQSLRDSLLDHVSKVTPDTNSVIVTQLCVALADLVMQMVNWKNAVSDLIHRFGEKPENVHFLLEVLTVLPEEINNRSLRLGANRRDEITQELIHASPLVLQLLTMCLESSVIDEKLQIKIFRCLVSWFNVSAIPQDMAVNSKLLMAPFHVLINQDCPSSLHEVACDCVCAALYCAEDFEKNSLLAQALFHGVLTLPEAYHLSVADEDTDKSINYCRVFTEMAESFIEAIVSTPNQGFGDFRILDLLLTCIGHFQYEVADITFNFWYRLSELLYSSNNYQDYNQFRPYIERLVVALCRHCELEPDHDGIPDDNTEFGDFRTRVSELIKDVVFIIGSSSCFAQIFNNLKSQTGNVPWEVTEAALFVMTAIAKNILPEENSAVVTVVLQAMISLPEDTHIAVRYTGIQLLGELCEWVDQHPQFLDPVLQFLLTGLQQPLLATVAATSLQNISQTCRQKMTGHFNGLLHIIQAVDTFHVSNDAVLGLLKGSALILAKMPNDKITEGFTDLCSVQVASLRKVIADSSQAKVTPGSKEDPAVWLDRLAAIFRHTNPNAVNGQVHPCQSVIQQIWPVLSDACAKYQGDVRVVERCCRCIRFAVRCVGTDSSAMLTPLVTQMIQLYQVYQHSCFLYLGSILVDEYGRLNGCQQGLLDMTQAFLLPTFKLLEEPNGFRNHPDTVDDLFRLCLRFIQRAPIVFLQSSMGKSVLCCAIAACNLDHRDANASVMKFLVELIKAGSEKDDKDDFEARKSIIISLLDEHGQTLVHALIQASLHSLPSYMVVDVADVIYEIMLVDRPSVCKWLEHTLKGMLPVSDTPGVSVTATHKQVTDFHKEVTSAEDCKTVSRSLREFVRLYR